MTTFRLPDLGEGLPDAEISEWHVKVGDTVREDDPLVSMETAKAVVDVPSPHSGKITRLHGQKGDIIKTGSPLVEFDGGDQGTVVGSIDATGSLLQETYTIGTANHSQGKQPLATPRVKQLAKKLQVSLDKIIGTGANGVITLTDVEQYAAKNQPAEHQQLEGYKPLQGARRHMSLNMTLAHQQVVPVTIFDDADIAHWDNATDITTRIIQALIAACEKEPRLNSWFDGKTQSILQHPQIDLGVAMDTGDALFVPVIKNAQQHDAASLRETINRFKQGVRERNLAQEELQGATITLSNFGNFAGRYASPIIVPPTVAILAVGRIRTEAVVNQGEICMHKVLPLSLSFDHRAATGGEATRFLGYVIEALQMP